MIPRLAEKLVASYLAKWRKIILIFGPRQVGKTTLLESLKAKQEKKGQRVLYLSADLEEERSLIDTQSLAPLKSLLDRFDLLLLDEAQHLGNPGLTLKIIHDNLPHLQVAATGSSSFQLRNLASDALTGRFLDLNLYPLSWQEIINYRRLAENDSLRKRQSDGLLPQALLYGLYPEIYLEETPSGKQLLLEKIVTSYLFKDILTFQKVRHSQALVNLSRALAYQIGAEVNESELASRLRIDRKTVVKYLDLLEQSFVIFRVYPYSTNPRREIGRNYKVYFLDVGLRNALIGDFNSPEVRADLGALWENFIIAERLKKAANEGQPLRYYFWRTYGGAEVDWLEQDKKGKRQAFECKYQKKSLSRGAQEFSKRYQLPVNLVNLESYLGFLV